MSVEIDAALYTALTEDTDPGGVNNADTGATSGIHNRVAPQSAGFPRIEFRELVVTPEYTFRELAADHVFYQIKVLATDSVSSGDSIAQNLNERLRVLLTDNDLSLGLLYCRFERSIPPYEEWDGKKWIYHNGGIYELWLNA